MTYGDIEDCPDAEWDLADDVEAEERYWDGKVNEEEDERYGDSTGFARRRRDDKLG